MEEGEVSEIPRGGPMFARVNLGADTRTWFWMHVLFYRSRFVRDGQVRMRGTGFDGHRCVCFVMLFSLLVAAVAAFPLDDAGKLLLTGSFERVHCRCNLD